MAKMRAAMAAVLVLEKENVTQAFGVPGAAINPFYAALRERQSIAHVLARHVEGASHMAEGYTRAQAGNIGVCIGTSGPAGTDMITGLYSASADSIPILCITGQAPRARLYKEDFQAVDIESIAAGDQVGGHRARAGAGAARAAAGLSPDALGPPRPGAGGPALRRADGRDRFRYRHLRALAGVPAPRHAQAGREGAGHAGRVRPPPIVAGGGVINADASALLVELAELTGVPVIPTLMGWGAIPDDHPLMAGMCGLQTSHRYGNATLLASDFVLGLGNRWANRHTGSVETYVRGRKFVHVDIEPTQIGRVFNPDLGIVSDAGAALALFIEVARERKAAGRLRDYTDWAARCAERKRLMRRRTDFDNVPIKPQRVYEEMNAAFGRDTIYVSTIGLSQIAGAQFLHVYGPRRWINCGQAGPLGWTVPAALGVVAADPSRMVVGLSGDYDFQFMIEELAVGAQFNLPYVQVLVNNSYLGLIRQAQRGFDMDYCVQLAFENQNVSDPALQGYGVDHVQVIQGLGCKAIRVTDPGKLRASLLEAQALARKHRVPVVVEVILERVTNIAMGTEIDNIVEFEDIDCRHPEGAKGLAEAGLLA